MRIVIPFIILFFIFGCVAQPKPMPVNDRIKVGMDESDVRKILGLPDLWESYDNEKEEVWQYCLTKRFMPVNDAVRVWFLDRKVTGVEIYKNVGFGACEMFFRSIKWENAPHRKSNQ